MEQQVDVQHGAGRVQLDGGPCRFSASDRASANRTFEVNRCAPVSFCSRTVPELVLTGKVSQAALTASVEQLAELENLKGKTVAPIQSHSSS
jgi:hypothetical protein